MQENERYVSPIYNERVDQEEFVSVCMDILRNARNEIYLSIRFLDVALSSLYFAPDLSVRGIATDGSGLFFEPTKLAKMYRKSRVLVNRTYLHAVLHCLFCHMWNRKKRAEDYWNLACDIVVESMIDDLNKRIADKNIKVELTQGAVDAVIEAGYDPIYGARPLKRVIQRYVEDKLSEEILRGNLKENSCVKLDVADGDFILIKE